MKHLIKQNAAGTWSVLAHYGWPMPWVRISPCFATEMEARNWLTIAEKDGSTKV